MYQALNDFVEKEFQKLNGKTAGGGEIFQALNISLKQAVQTRGVVSSPPVLQVLPAPLRWNWRYPPSGETYQEEYNFLDHMPSGPEDQTYVQSAKSFSDNYRQFLCLLDQTKFPPGYIAKAISANTPPEGSTIPKGWTTVVTNEEGSLPRPAWTIPVYPTDWINGVSSIPKSMNLDLSAGDTNLALGPQNSVVEGGAIVKLGFSASAWGAIPISPGSWYDSSIIGLARGLKAPYKSEEWTNDKVFGPDGLLSSRVAVFIVALNPTAVAEVKNSALNATGHQSAPAEIKFGSFRFSTDPTAEGTIAASISYEAASSDSTRICMTSGFNQAYIIAVYVTPGRSL